MFMLYFRNEVRLTQEQAIIIGSVLLGLNTLTFVGFAVMIVLYVKSRKNRVQTVDVASIEMQQKIEETGGGSDEAGVGGGVENVSSE